MTKKPQKQLELPILTDVNSKFSIKSLENTSLNSSAQTNLNTSSDFHKPASKQDQSIYQLISDSYFSLPNK